MTSYWPMTSGACLLLIVVAIAGGAATSATSGKLGAAEAAIEAQNVPKQASYTIEIQGTTYTGSTAFPQRDTTYTPEQRFRIAGKLVIIPGQDRTGITGINARDIGIFCGNPTAGQAGATWFASNTRVFAIVRLGSVTHRDANLNAAKVTVNEATGALNVTVAPRSRAMASQLNCFNTRSGVTALPYQITGGKLVLRFSADGTRVNGQMSFLGTGYVGPANSAISASISGARQ
jgi:hypothetical protein